MSPEPSALIELGIVGAPFGVRGWVKLRSYTDPPEGLLEHRHLQLKVGGAWRSFAVEARGGSGGQLTAKLAGVETREAAQGLRGAPIGVSRSELPRPEAREFYRADLIGCDVVNLSGMRLGAVTHFIEIPAHALMVVRGEREYWVPAVPQHLRRVDLRSRRVVVDWDEPAD
ncbi:MAG TPA: ribosome maturation factor RimM [Steroidobacteraceae bacterium]|jgi:16S rRNA processing protein RimM|nr:ribosome maturation factor RimM [Steroidobacteraceae bacterium]